MEKKLFIEDFNISGEGIAFDGTKKIAICHALIQDIVLADISKRKNKGFYKARLLEVQKKSPFRVDPKCFHTRICGGCKWQEMQYSYQLQQKQKFILKNFEGMHNPDIYPIIPCKNPFFYRNKMEFSFSENKANTKFLGLMIASANRYVFNVDNCYIAPKWFSKTLNEVRIWWENSSISSFNYNTGDGTLRNLTIREGRHTREKMIVLTVSDVFTKKEIDTFLKALSIDASIFLKVHQARKKMKTQIYEMHLKGPDHIKENIFIFDKKLTFKISPSSFFQPNTLQAQIIYEKALEIAKPQKNDVVFDLYCGTGTFGMAFSFYAKNVIAIEQNPYAIIDLENNLKLNDIQNISVLKGDVGEVLNSINQKPDIVIVDPPRAGLDKLALQNIQRLLPKKIIYISCNPITQKNNILDLFNSGYKLRIIQPIDHFPHTAHIENIALLEL